MDLNGRLLEGERQISSEAGMHLLFYQMRPDVQAVCHAHPPTATGFAASGQGLDQALLPEVVVCLGKVPLVRYATPGTSDLSAVLEPYVPHYDALLLANHGAVTCGPDLLTAFYRMEIVEHFAKISLAARLAGQPQLLSTRESPNSWLHAPGIRSRRLPVVAPNFRKPPMAAKVPQRKSRSRALNWTRLWTKPFAKTALVASSSPEALHVRRRTL